jgi:hypothetical protein
MEEQGIDTIVLNDPPAPTEDGQPSRPHRPHAPRVLVTLTPEIIDGAERRSSSHCMWADALKLAVPEAKHVSVDLQTIRFTDSEKGLRFTYLTPRRAQVSLIRFDQGMHTEPCSVELRGGQVTKVRGYASHTRKHRGTMPDGARTDTRRPHTGGSSPPEIIGGTTPPVGPLANVHFGASRGKRRAFGLRQLEY